MSFTDELREILTEYCNHKRNISDAESVKSLLTKVSEDLRYELLSSITNSGGYTVLTVAADRAHTELRFTLLSSLHQLINRNWFLLMTTQLYILLHGGAAQRQYQVYWTVWLLISSYSFSSHRIEMVIYLGMQKPFGSTSQNFHR